MNANILYSTLNPTIVLPAFWEPSDYKEHPHEGGSYFECSVSLPLSLSLRFALRNKNRNRVAIALLEPNVIYGCWCKDGEYLLFSIPSARVHCDRFRRRRYSRIERDRSL
jgi:hypothetical protein